MHKVLGACLTVVATLLMAAGAAQAAPVEGKDRTYTSSAQFDLGTQVNVNSLTGDALRLNEDTSTFPFVWIALSLRCTIAKVDTETGAILGEYRTISDGRGCNESSRTTVGLDGSVWVGHRGPGGATHVGLSELNQCVDRNGNGTIDTSSGYDDVKAWTGGDSEVANAADECILHHVDTDSLGMNDTRHMSIDADDNLWIGDFSGGSNFVRVDALTGAVETGVFDMPCGGYGGLIDGDGIIWSAHGASNLLRWDPDAPTSATNPRCLGIPAYGLALAPDGHIWATNLGDDVFKLAPDGTTVLGPIPHGNSNAQGLAVDSSGDVWVSSSLFCGGGCSVGHLKSDGTLVGTVPTPTASGSTGVSIDADGKVWIANRASSNATRIDPEGGPLGCGGSGCGDGTRLGAVDLESVAFPATSGRPAAQPYNYSDMTGAQLLGSTAPQGRWSVVQDGGPGARWGRVRFNTEREAETPDGTTTLVEVRAAETEAGLGSAAFRQVAHDVPFDVQGRFLEVRVTLLPDAAGVSPVFSDLRVCAADVPCASAQERSGPATTGGVAGAQATCQPTSGFALVRATPQDGGRLRLAFARLIRNSVGVDVFQSSRGSRVLQERLVARFRGLSRSFTWDGEANRAGRRVADGVYFVRFSIEQANGRMDRRRITLMREDGEWSVRSPHYRRESCGLLTAYKLLRAAFAGPTRRGLGIAFQLSAPAQVTLEVLRGGRVVHTFPAQRYLAERMIRLRLPDVRAFARGDHQFRLTAVAGDRRVVATLTSRRL